MEINYCIDTNANQKLLDTDDEDEDIEDGHAVIPPEKLMEILKPYPEDLINAKKANTVEKRNKEKIEKILQSSVIKNEFEQLHSIPSKISKRGLIKQRRKERERTKGSKWYNLPAPEITQELKNDLDVLKMRSALDPKHFYKHNDLSYEPKYFQVGHVVEGPADFYNGRIPKSQRKKTLVEELMADLDTRAYQKRKYKEIVGENRNHKFKKAHAIAKKLKNKK